MLKQLIKRLFGFDKEISLLSIKTEDLEEQLAQERLYSQKLEQKNEDLDRLLNELIDSRNKLLETQDHRIRKEMLKNFEEQLNNK